jgi:hypothetical protein
MTTKTGLVGIITGLITTALIYPFFISWHALYLDEGLAASTSSMWIALALAILLMIGGGFLAARWSASVQPGRCIALGALVGGLAGMFIFCLWGAGTAGTVRWVSPIATQYSQVELIRILIRQTMQMFLVLFLGGGVLGMLGGWLAGPKQNSREDRFNKVEPQMAMNASITAVCASVVAAAVAAYVFSRLTQIIGGNTGGIVLDDAIVHLPLIVALLLVLISQAALTLVVPHETKQAEHRCGLNEVKMAAYVGIGTAPLLILLLALIGGGFFSDPLILFALLLCTSMSAINLRSLLKLVLPTRASFPIPQDERLKTEANLFGSIANSYGWRLVELCIGCGIMMVLPIHVTVLSILINLTGVSTTSAFTLPLSEGAAKIFLNQALISMGVTIITCTGLSLMYIFYLNLGRWFSSWNAKRLS